MKVHMTRNQLRRWYSRIYQTGYCELHPLAPYFRVVGYNAGIYGWNYDVYDFDNAAVTTGYRGMIGADLPEKAQRILDDAKKWIREHDAWDPDRTGYLTRAAAAFTEALNE